MHLHNLCSFFCEKIGIKELFPIPLLIWWYFDAGLIQEKAGPGGRVWPSTGWLYCLALIAKILCLEIWAPGQSRSWNFCLVTSAVASCKLQSSGVKDFGWMIFFRPFRPFSSPFLNCATRKWGVRLTKAEKDFSTYIESHGPWGSMDQSGKIPI